MYKTLRYKFNYIFERKGHYTFFYFKLKTFNKNWIQLKEFELTKIKVQNKSSEKHLMNIYKQIVAEVLEWEKGKGHRYNLTKLMTKATNDYFRGLDIAKTELEKVIKCEIHIEK